MDYDCVKEMKCCSNGCYKICIPPADDDVTAPAAAGKTLDSMTTQSYKSVFIVSNYCKKKRISFTLPPIGVGRGKGSWGTRKPPLKAFLGKQPTIFRWRKRHDDILTAKKKTFLKSPLFWNLFRIKVFSSAALVFSQYGPSRHVNSSPSKTRLGGRHDNLVSTLCLTQCETTPPSLWKILATPLRSQCCSRENFFGSYTIFSGSYKFSLLL